MLGVGLPCAGDGQVLPRRHAGDAPHNGDDLPLLGEQAKDRISIFGVLKNNAMYRALPADQFLHGMPLSFSLFIPAGYPARRLRRHFPHGPPDTRQGPVHPPSARSPR